MRELKKGDRVVVEKDIDFIPTKVVKSKNLNATVIIEKDAIGFDDDFIIIEFDTKEGWDNEKYGDGLYWGVRKCNLKLLNQNDLKYF